MALEVAYKQEVPGSSPGPPTRRITPWRAFARRRRSRRSDHREVKGAVGERARSRPGSWPCKTRQAREGVTHTARLCRDGAAPELSRTGAPITRRDALKGAAGLAAIGAGGGDTWSRPLVPPAAPRGRRPQRVAIVGAGAGGIAAAYFLAGTHDVELFEARGRIGGHCDSRTGRATGAIASPSTSARSSSTPTPTRSTSRSSRRSASTTPSTPRPTRRSSRRAACACSRSAAGRRSSPPRTRSRPCRGRSTSRPHATRAPGGADRPAMGDQRGRVDPQPALRAALQGRGRRSVDHGDDRLVPSGRDALVGARDPADVRARLPRGPRPPGHHVHLAHRTPGQPAAAARPQPGGGGAPARARPGPGGKRRALVRAHAARAARTRSDHVVLNAPPRAGRELLRPLPAFAQATALFGAYRTSTRAS